MRVYVSKNIVRRLKNYPCNNYGIELIKLLRWTLENDDEFREEYERVLKEEASKKERNERSLRRTRKDIQDILNANLDDRSYFLTLTFKENLKDYKKANNRFHYYIRHKNENIKYLAIKEHQKRGAIHYHLIVFDIEEEDLKKLKSSWTYGFSHSKKITNKYIPSISNYLTKYLTKEKNQLVEAGYRIFTKSRNLKKPLVISRKVVDKILIKYKYDIDLESYDWLQHDYIIEEKPKHNIAVDFVKSP